MKRFTTLLLLAFGAILGLSACSSEPETDALTSTVWTIPNLTTTSGGTTTTIDVTISFIRKGQASIEVGYGEFTQNIQDGGSQTKKRELSATCLRATSTAMVSSTSNPPYLLLSRRAEHQGHRGRDHHQPPRGRRCRRYPGWHDDLQPHGQR